MPEGVWPAAAGSPVNLGNVTLIQIASPGRESVDAHAAVRQALERRCSPCNDNFGARDWMPLRVIHRTVARKIRPTRKCSCSRDSRARPTRCRRPCW
ncbi:MAG: trehalose-6-phosphate synthase [Hydrogenophaga sp.]|nr:trehalose-6-phosphate synthase [Hydrogenophaga sp.]